MATKDRIFPHDTYLVAIEARRTDPTDQDNSEGLPATVVSAVVTMLNSSTSSFMEIGGTGITTAAATITPPSGNVGSIVSYLVPSAFTGASGDYVIYVQCLFNDGFVLTEDRKLKVNELQ